MVSLKKLIFVPLALPALIDAKNVVEMITFRDENNRLYKRLAPEEYKGGNLIKDDDSALRKRDLSAQRPANKEDFFEMDDDTVGTDNIDVPNTYLDSMISVLKNVDIFAAYSRNDEKVSDMFKDPESDMIVIVPSNDAFAKLSKKPWQFPKNIEEMEKRGSSVRDIDNAIHSNIVHFVRSHVIPFQIDEERKKDGSVLLKSSAYMMEFPNRKGGDILLKQNGDSYCVASVMDGIFHDVDEVHVTRNGAILVIHSTLLNPEA